MTDVTRRKFLVRAIAIMAGAIGAMIGAPAISYLIGPSNERSNTGEWIPLGLAASVVPGDPVLMKTTVERTSGWLVDTQEVSVFVSTENGQDFTAHSNICTHLGCRVRWVADQAGFFCPCHNAIFNRDGSVSTGPPPRPLDSFETMVEEGTIFIKEA